ncbi:MAG TPA: hypothetical protein VGE74_15260 [Gemmata sp.]
MRPQFVAALMAALFVTALGCERKSTYDGPTVEKFGGRVVANGKAVQFPEGETVQLKVFHEKGQSFNVPVKADGTFDVGWMPIGKYSVTLLRLKSGQKGQPNQYGVPGGLHIESAQTEHKVDLGPNWKP